MNNKLIISHPTGNMNTRAAVIGFCKKNLLKKFYTCIACFENTLLYKLSGLFFLREFRRRQYDNSLKAFISTYSFRELGRHFSNKFKIFCLLRREIGFFCVDKVYQSLDNHVAHNLNKYRNSIQAVYAYEDCALKTFRKAKELQKYCVYDLPIGYWRSMRELLSAEQENNPEWAMTLGGFNDSEEKLKRKDEELALADKIYVASSFTKKTLDLYPGELADIEVIPYGFPPINEKRIYKPFDGRKIKLLFVGGLSQRKGISYLFNAVEGLEDKIELTVVGRGNVESCPRLKQALGKVNYIPSLSHDAVLKLMAEHDLFVFPSLFEGFGLVITEAMSQGTPVITTDRTCGPDIIENEIDGWIVEAANSSSIRKLLEIFIENPTQLHDVGKNALKKASSRPWSYYEKELAISVNNFLNKHGGKIK